MATMSFLESTVLSFGSYAILAILKQLDKITDCTFSIARHRLCECARASVWMGAAYTEKD